MSNRRPKYRQHERIPLLRGMLECGMTMIDIAKVLDVSYPTIRRDNYLRKELDAVNSERSA